MRNAIQSICWFCPLTFVGIELPIFCKRKMLHVSTNVVEVLLIVIYKTNMFKKNVALWLKWPKTIILIFIGRGSNIWFQDYFTSLDLCMQRNGLLQDSAYCQRQMKQTGQMSWTNVFREEVEIIKTEGKFVRSTLSGLIIDSQSITIFVCTDVCDKCRETTINV